MTGDRWISVSGAADFIETEDAEQLINQAWKRGAIRLQGVRPGESAPVEIPPSEEGAIDCTQSRLVVAGGLFATYDSVSAEWDGVLRLVDALREPPPEHIDEQELGPRVYAVAEVLRKKYGRNPPAMGRVELREEVRKEAVATIGKFSLTTLDRARFSVWPELRRHR